jgi:hypothetical protein
MGGEWGDEKSGEKDFTEAFLESIVPFLRFKEDRRLWIKARL